MLNQQSMQVKRICDEIGIPYTLGEGGATLDGQPITAEQISALLGVTTQTAEHSFRINFETKTNSQNLYDAKYNSESSANKVFLMHDREIDVYSTEPGSDYRLSA